MPAIKPEWKPLEGLPLGRGATVQAFTASVGGEAFQIEVSPWDEGSLKVNGRQIAHVDDARTGGRHSAS